MTGEATGNPGSFDTNGEVFHIADAEITLLTDAGTRVVTSQLAECMLPLHMHPHYELFFVERGTLRVLFENEELLLAENDLIVIRPNVEHVTLLRDENSSRINLKFHIRKNSLEQTNSFYGALDAAFLYPCVLLRNHLPFRETLNNLYQAMLRQDSLYECFYFHDFAVRFLSIAPALANKASAKPLRMENNVMRYHTVSSLINGEFKNNITLRSVAKALNLSVRQTNRVIQECYGMPFSELVLENKMRYAAKLLKDTALPVTEIARETGYSSVKGFYHSFKKRFRVLPVEYRKQYGKKDDG